MPTTTSTLQRQSRMADVLAAFPGARRALFRKYHIGGCSSCGFAPDETLEQLSTRNGALNVEEVIAHIEAAAETDRQLEITPAEASRRRAAGETVRLLDLRTREEWDAVRIPGAEFVTQELIQQLMGRDGHAGLMVFYDHSGASSIDAAAYFAGHGFANARFMRGGIDAWSQDVDSTLPRYKLEQT